MEEWGNISKQKSKWLANKRSEQAWRWGFKPFICEMRLCEYKSTLIDKCLNYFISVKLLILETIVSQRPWRCVVCIILHFNHYEHHCFTIRNFIQYILYMDILLLLLFLLLLLLVTVVAVFVIIIITIIIIIIVVVVVLASIS